jgi:hypothetical protein
MGTLENLSALSEELRGTRDRLEAVADRAAALRKRLATNGPTILSLDRLAQERHPPTPKQEPHTAERFEGEEGGLGTDTWEISLINEEG